MFPITHLFLKGSIFFFYKNPLESLFYLNKNHKVRQGSRSWFSGFVIGIEGVIYVYGHTASIVSPKLIGPILFFSFISSFFYLISWPFFPLKGDSKNSFRKRLELINSGSRLMTWSLSLRWTLWKMNISFVFY